MLDGTEHLTSLQWSWPRKQENHNDPGLLPWVLCFCVMESSTVFITGLRLMMSKDNSGCLSCKLICHVKLNTKKDLNSLIMFSVLRKTTCRWSIYEVICKENGTGIWKTMKIHWKVFKILHYITRPWKEGHCPLKISCCHQPCETDHQYQDWWWSVEQYSR